MSNEAAQLKILIFLIITLNFQHRLRAFARYACVRIWYVDVEITR